MIFIIMAVASSSNIEFVINILSQNF